MNTTRKLGRIDAVSIMLVCSLVLMGAGLVGCPGDLVIGPCADVTVDGTDANNEYGDFTFEADQCDVTIAGGVLEIDILDRSATGATIPRVLFTLEITGADIPLATFDLTRPDDTLPEPAIYQDLVDNDADPAEGRFWVSSSGSITFSLDADGNTIGTFEFEADNPPDVIPATDPTGTLNVNGTVTVMTAEVPEGPCGLGAGSASMMMLLGLYLMRSQKRWRRRK